VAKIKLEKLICKQNISDNVENARHLILDNRILVNGSLQNNVNASFDSSVQISLTKEAKKYVSRGGYKLEKALKDFDINVTGLKALDVGASTGGFTDCLLQNGADHVIAIDVGRSQLDEKIRKHKNVTIHERLNAKDLNIEITSGTCDICVIDVSFTSILPLLPAIFSVLTESAPIIALIKPQFEGNKEQMTENGIITDPETHIAILKRFIENFPTQYRLKKLEGSPITGAKGNIEFISLFEPYREGSKIEIIDIANIVQIAHQKLKENK